MFNMDLFSWNFQKIDTVHTKESVRKLIKFKAGIIQFNDTEYLQKHF